MEHHHTPQTNEVVNLDFFKKTKRNALTDREKLIFGYHFLADGKIDEGKNMLSSISQNYYMSGIYRDLSRALLCHAAFKHSGNPAHQQESEFYLVVYKLIKIIIDQNILFHYSGYFVEMSETLFQDV